MKKLSISLLLAGCVAVMSMAAGDPIKVNVEKSQVEWLGEKVTGEHNGTIMLKEGMLEMENGMLTGGSFVMDMGSIKNLDMAGKDGAAKLEGHLKSPDFFNVAEYPTATLELTEVVSRGTPGS